MSTVPIMGMQSTLNDDPDKLGVGLTIFASGCIHKCKNCQNPESQDVSNGTPMTLEEIKRKIYESVKLVKSVTFSGGDFYLYTEALKELSTYAKLDLKLKTILYTGFKYEDLDQEIINHIDIIIDGKYNSEEAQNTFPASKNQNVFKNGKQLSEKEIKELRINN